MMTEHPNEFTLARVRRLIHAANLPVKIRPETGGYVLSRGSSLPGENNSAENFTFKIECHEDGRWYFCRINEAAEWVPLAVYDSLEGAMAVVKRFVFGDEVAP